MNTPINIIYPIIGQDYPNTNPRIQVKSAYLTFAFSVTRKGGSYKVKWGVNGDTLGAAQFYDFYNTQQVYKLPKGNHYFWVKCGRKKEVVKFSV